MKLCVVSFKQCWQDAGGRWYSYGGFPAQMDALRTLCDEMTIVIVRSHARNGGMPLPADARVVGLRSPRGADFRRKVSVVSRLPYYLRHIGREVRSADIVHTPVPGDLPLLGLVMAVLLRTPVFALYNGSWEPNSQTTVMNRVTRQLLRLLARGSNVMLAVGDGAAPPARGMHWLYATSLGAHDIAPLDDGGAARGLASPPHLIYAGRLSAEKGVPVLLRALARVRSELPATAPILTLAGDGPERPALERLVHELGMADRVRFAGQLDRAALVRILRTADFAVHPSHTEGYCKAWLDAMAQGLPVLATEVGAARTVIGAHGVRGWLVPPGDEAALADAIGQVLSEPIDWTRLRSACRAYASTRTLDAWAGDIGRTLATHWALGQRNGALAWVR